MRPEAAMWLEVLKAHPEVRSIYGMHMGPMAIGKFLEMAGVVQELVE